jgi:hypothetical protein
VVRVLQKDPRAIVKGLVLHHHPLGRLLEMDASGIDHPSDSTTSDGHFIIENGRPKTLKKYP